MWTIIVTEPGGTELVRTYLRVGTPVTIGRAPDNTVMLKPMAAPRHHGRIELRNGVPVYFDGEDSTGTLENGQYIRGPTEVQGNTVLEIHGYKFSAEPVNASKAATAAKSEAKEKPAPVPENWIPEALDDGDDDSAEAMLARRIQGIRTHRERNRQGATAERQRFDKRWTELIASVRKLQGQLIGHDRILSFAVDREEQEVMVKVKDDNSRGYTTFILAEHHPNGKLPELMAAWLLELGRDDMHYSDPKEAMEEFIHRLAPRLA